MSDLSHERIRAYVQLGRAALTGAEQVALDEHLRECVECRAYAEHVAKLQAALAQTLHQRWDAQPVPKFAPRVTPRLRKNNLPRQVLNYAVGLGALAALIFLLQAFFTTQLQLTTQSPIATVSLATDATSTPQSSTAMAVTPLGANPTPTPPSGRDFYQVQRLTNTASGAFRPAVSPDGQRVAYASEREGNWDIYVIDLNTKIETRLTDDALPDMAPAWSPAGTQLAYQHNVPSTDGPVLVDYTVMRADGSNKRVVFSGARWLKNDAPQWSPAGDRLAFSNGTELIAVALNDQSSDVILQLADQQPYSWPTWFDNEHLLYIGNGQMRYSDMSGNNQVVLTLPNPVQIMTAATPYIAFIRQEGTTTHVGRTGLDEIATQTLAAFEAGPLEHAALSPNGQLVAIQTDGEIVVVAANLPSAWQLAPLFRFSNNIPASDLASVAWLPDSSGFIFSAEAEGNPELHLAQLNLSAIDYLKSLSAAAQTPVPTPNPTDISAFGSIVTSFSPDPALTLDGSSSFSFGAMITTASQIDVLAHISAFPVRPEEALADCTSRSIPTDRLFWANQANFSPGQIIYSQNFSYINDGPGADRLVIRISLIEPGVSGRLLYCTQQVYSLLPSRVPVTATPFATSTPFTSPTPAPTPMNFTPTPVPPRPAPSPTTTLSDRPPATPLPTNTPLPPSSTPLPTDTPWPPTSTALPTNTPLPPSSTPLPTMTATPCSNDC